MLFTVAALLLALSSVHAVSGPWEIDNDKDDRKRATGTPHWSHDDIDRWAVDFKTCGEGKVQSPINIVTGAVGKCSGKAFDSKRIAL
jgi:carbonic anhydrase